MKYYTQNMTILGRITKINPEKGSFQLLLRSGDKFEIYVGPETYFSVLSNIDGMNYDRVPEPSGKTTNAVDYKMKKYIREGRKVYVQGLHIVHENTGHFDANRIILLHYEPEGFIFEDKTHWWLTQIRVLADEWLQDLFGDTRDYTHTDFSKLYRTNLNIYGSPKDDDMQVMATLSRLVYGLSSAFMLLGDIRFFKAAAAGINFQRTAFKSISSKGTINFWAFGRKPFQSGSTTIFPSQNSDDYGSIPLYEQIYALAGLCQYYRITNDSTVLADIMQTVNMFNEFFLDDPRYKELKGFPGEGGYFSHIDPITRRPDTINLGDNKLQKNWNSIGDHIPAYLINLILALDPLPKGSNNEIEEFLKTCHELLDCTTNLIIDKFPDKESIYVNERFNADWKPNHEWGWQKNRAIVGHNLKIAWNLTRVANYYLDKGDEETAKKAMKVAETLENNMEKAGLDLVRGGCFDAVERHPADNRFVQPVWGNHKDFWQQEQAILAYLILYGHTRNEKYLELYRDTAAWWNAFHLDHENSSIYFRVQDDGEPYIKGRGMAGYDIAGYHSFELNYLAHIYLRTYVDHYSEDKVHFTLYFRPDERTNIESINVLPDFIRKKDLEVAGIIVDGIPRAYVDTDNFQVPVEKDERGKVFLIQFRSKVEKLNKNSNG